MKKILITIAITVFANLTYARPLNSIVDARTAKGILSQALENVNGVNGFSLTGCDPETGTIANTGEDFVYCVKINSIDEQTMLNLASIYPMGSKVNGTFVVLSVAGVVNPYPRMSGGN